MTADQVTAAHVIADDVARGLGGKLPLGAYRGHPRRAGHEGDQRSRARCRRTEYGKPFSRAGFGNKMREWCDEAGLPQCTAHGLRKAMARRLAESEESQQSIKAVGGWKGDAEVAIYTAAADQKRLAHASIGRLSAADLANRASGLANRIPQPPKNEG